MHITGKILTNFSEKFQIPGEIMPGVPRIELIGTQQVSMEPHQGLLEYGQEKISVQSGLGIVRIWGKELKILVMNSRRITITGRIDRVEWMESVHE